MRVKYWSYLLNDEGQPIENANIYVYEAGTLNSVYVYTSESGSTYTNTVPQTTTNSDGYFEFWIADNNESNGYSRSQKFRIKWFKANITEGDIDNVSILPMGTGYYSETTTTWTSGASGYYCDVNHGLNRDYPIVQCYNSSTKKKEDPIIVSISTNTIRLWNTNNIENFEVFIVG
jgi:hypothetical protein